MAKTMCVILGLAFLAQGILGITGLVPELTSDLNYINIAEIVLGALGLLVGIYAPQNKKYSQQTKDGFSQQRQEIEQLRKENEQFKKEKEQKIIDSIEQQKLENEQLKQQLEQQKRENEEIRQKLNIEG